MTDSRIDQPQPTQVAPAPGTTPLPNSAGLLPRVRAGDDQAARELVDLLFPLVLRIVRAHLPRRAAEEDLAQDIFLKMFLHLDQFQGRVPFEHWVSRIAVNHCRNAIRAQASRPEWRMSDLVDDAQGLMDRVEQPASSQSEPADDISAIELVERLLSILDPRDRALMRWLEMEDRTIEQISRETGWSSTLIRVRAFRARRKLNARFGQLRKEGKL